MKIIPLILVSAVVAIPMLAQAHYPYTQEECKEFASFIYLATKAKENGFDAEKIKAATASSIQQLYGVGSFIRDEADARAAMASVVLVLSQGMSPDMQMTAAYEDCVKELMRTTEL